MPKRADGREGEETDIVKQRGQQRGGLGDQCALPRRVRSHAQALQSRVCLQSVRSSFHLKTEFAYELLTGLHTRRGSADSCIFDEVLQTVPLDELLLQPGQMAPKKPPKPYWLQTPKKLQWIRRSSATNRLRVMRLLKHIKIQKMMIQTLSARLRSFKARTRSGIHLLQRAIERDIDQETYNQHHLYQRMEDELSTDTDTSSQLSPG